MLGGKWPFPGGEGALGESIRSGATRLGAGGLRGGGREPWEEAWGCRDVPACPLHGETSKEKEREKESTAEFVTWGREGGGDGTDGSDTGGSEQARAVLWG